MLNRKAIVRHERNNASAAAEILRNRASQSLVMILWAEAFQRRQRRARAEPIAIAATTATAGPQRHQRDQRATTAPPMRQRQLPLPLQDFTSST